MKMQCLLCAMFMALTAPVRAAGNDPVAILQKGLFEEEANHDLKAAIQTYQSVITQFDKDRKLAATAIFRLGECYRKQGNTNDASAQYQRVIREFPDQEQVVNLSRQNLAALGSSPGVPRAQGSEATSPEADVRAQAVEPNAAAAEAERLKVQLAELRSLPPDKKRIAVQQELPNAVLTSLMQRLGQAEQDLAAKRIDYGPDHAEVRKAVELVKVLEKQVNEQVDGALRALEIRQTAAAAAAGAMARTEPNVTPRTSAETEELKRIRAMIADSPDLINAKDQQGRTPLHRAVAASQLAVAQFLLENGADIKAIDNAGRTPLHLAVLAGNKGLVDLLLSKGANVNAVDYEGKTPLFVAAEKGFKTILEVLLEHGANARAQTRAEMTPLHAALQNGFKSIAQLLLARGADVNSVGSGGQVPPLWIAASLADEAMTQLLLTNGANVNLAPSSTGMTPLEVAAQRGAVGVMRLLLARGAEVNARNQNETQRGWTALHYAVDAQQQDAVKLLLDKKADPNARLEVSYSPGGTFTAMRPGESPDPGYTPLLIAAGIHPSAEITQLLLAAKADPNLKSERGVSPLQRAMMLPPPLRKTIAALLLDQGADPNARDGDQKTPIFWAVQNKDKEVAALLLDHKADVNRKGPFEATALHMVIYSLPNNGTQMGSNQDALEIAQMLLVAGADANAQDYQGETPLKRLGEQSDFGVKEKLTALLRKHGATEDLPRMDRIEVRRPSANYTETVFSRGTNDYNRFSLFELLAVHYRLVSTATSSGPLPVPAFTPGVSPGILSAGARAMIHGPLPFPALEKVVIRKPTADGKGWREARVDLAQMLESGDCSSDKLLQWGDVVEIPEADHPINAVWQGLPQSQLLKLQECLRREVQVTVKGQTTKIALVPNKYQPQQFMLVPVLNNSGLLRASSDLSRVKVNRHDSATGQRHELVLDCSKASVPPDFWLRDGDQIDVPEKP